MADNQKQSAVLHRVLLYIRKYWGFVCLSLLLAVVSVAASLAIPVFVGSAIDYMLETGKVDFEKVSFYLVAGLTCTLLSGCAHWLMSQMNNSITYRVSRDIRNDEAVVVILNHS